MTNIRRYIFGLKAIKNHQQKSTVLSLSICVYREILLTTQCPP